MYFRDGENLGATVPMVGRICPPGWNRVKVSENLGATPVAPVAPVDTSLHLHKYPIAARVDLNSFARQYLIRKRNIENQVKTSCLKMLVSKGIATLMLMPWWFCIVLSLVMTSASYCFQ